MSTIGALLGTLGTGAPGPAPGVAGVTDHVIAAKRSAILRYWTVRRMLRAVTPPERPRHRPPAGPPPVNPLATADVGSPVGSPLGPAGRRAVAPAVPRAHATDTPVPYATGTRDRRTTDTPGRQGAATTDRQAIDAAGGHTVHGAPGSPWISSGAVRVTTGKVFFTINGGDYVCSAGTIAGANRDLVVTAGHCVQDAAGAWARNWLYVPGYDQGRRPYGAFTARHLFVPAAWSGRHDENSDVAIVALAAAGGRHVTDVVGAQTVAFDQPRGAVVYGFGYPTGGHYDGERLAYCSGRTYPDRHRLTQDQGLRCDMSEGASGGPWLAGFDLVTGRGVVTSVNSFKYSDDPATMYGPYFDAAVRRVYEQAQHA
ncbi:trypsin-like peptidase domain-containing protein [Actinoallomurus sp. NPDC050550]|uniref:trypsin-like serine peptidase n=1 Tax=Actinoallomurus sp. NPDC050550 TaxID=3154937 RepID=UPI0033E91DDB